MPTQLMPLPQVLSPPMPMPTLLGSPRLKTPKAAARKRERKVLTELATPQGRVTRRAGNHALPKVARNVIAPTAMNLNTSTSGSTSMIVRRTRAAVMDVDAKAIEEARAATPHRMIAPARATLTAPPVTMVAMTAPAAKSVSDLNAADAQAHQPPEEVSDVYQNLLFEREREVHHAVASLLKKEPGDQEKILVLQREEEDLHPRLRARVRGLDQDRGQKEDLGLAAVTNVINLVAQSSTSVQSEKSTSLSTKESGVIDGPEDSRTSLNHLRQC